MKRISLFAVLTAFLAIGCSDDSTEGSNDISTADFLPLQTGNYWVYDVDGSTVNGRDSLFISGDTLITGNTYKKFKTEDQAFGFYSNALRNNGIRKSGDKLLLTGAADLGFAAQFPLSINVSDFTIFKENATAGQQLATVSGTVTQPYDGYSIVFNYTLSSTAKAAEASHTVNGELYQDIRPVETKLSLNVVAQFTVSGITIPYTIMPQQDVVVSTQYYAKNIGAVHVVTTINYQLADLSQLTDMGVTLPLPQSGSDSQEEKLDLYNVQ